MSGGKPHCHVIRVVTHLHGTWSVATCICFQKVFYKFIFCVKCTHCWLLIIIVYIKGPHGKQLRYLLILRKITTRYPNGRVLTFVLYNYWLVMRETLWYVDIVLHYILKCIQLEWRWLFGPFRWGIIFPNDHRVHRSILCQYYMMSSNLPCLYSTLHLEYPLVLSRFWFK